MAQHVMQSLVKILQPLVKHCTCLCL